MSSTQHQRVLRLWLHQGGSEKTHIPVSRRGAGALGSPREPLRVVEVFVHGGEWDSLPGVLTIGVFGSCRVLGQ